MTTSETKVKKPKAVKATKATKTVKAVAKTTTKDSKEPKTKKKKEDGKVVLRIRVRAYESKILDASVKQIIDTAMRYDATVVGPVPLPTEIKKYTVNRASFIYKNTREQFEIRVHKRLIDIINPSAKTVEALTNLSLPSGVDIDVKML
ncbi:30S ribosomal protein S10 [Patescibacteria group bacterium]|nr:30S ribosomal protein S10 [Patescibacteria group bacterium]MBU1728215.1 30S ribosomal protein S10 [Patescibacteria group bacterium]